MNSYTFLRAASVRSAVFTAPRPGGRSRSSVTSRSPYSVSASERGIGVAVRSKTSGASPFSTRAARCSTPKRCCSSTTVRPRRWNLTDSWIRACVPTTRRAAPREMLLEPGGELLLERERDPRAGALREMARAGLHELLVEELVEREAPPAGLGVVQVPRPVHGGERRAQLGNPHGRAQPRRMGIAD